jgi:hypothetical protein
VDVTYPPGTSQAADPADQTVSDALDCGTDTAHPGAGNDADVGNCCEASGS